MKNYRLLLKSIVDGESSLLSVDAELEVVDGKTCLRYRQEPADICVTFHQDKAWIERQGDYALRLCLCEGERTEGELGIGGSVGALQTHAHAVECDFSDGELSARLRYDLLFGEELQKMELFFRAKQK